MKITQDVREYAKQKGVGEETALELGLQEKAAEFRRQGGRVYKKA
jgi:phosphomethylpyrimidine synthase